MNDRVLGYWLVVFYKQKTAYENAACLVGSERCRRDRIEKDLTFARENLPEAWDAADLGRATKGAAKALLGKAYMQQHKYDRAKEQLQWLIDREGSLYGLLDNREDNFTDLNENNQEGIFEIQFDDQNKGGTGNDASMAFGF